MLVEPGIEQAPWGDQARSDASLYLKQIEYLFDRSRFYREKLERAGIVARVGASGVFATLSQFAAAHELSGSSVTDHSDHIGL